MARTKYYIWRIEDGTRYGAGELVTTTHGLREAKKLAFALSWQTGYYYQVRDKRNNIL